MRWTAVPATYRAGVRSLSPDEWGALMEKASSEAEVLPKQGADPGERRLLGRPANWSYGRLEASSERRWIRIMYGLERQK